MVVAGDGVGVGGGRCTEHSEQWLQENTKYRYKLLQPLDPQIEDALNVFVCLLADKTPEHKLFR